MRTLIFGVCLLAAACGTQSSSSPVGSSGFGSPTAPSPSPAAMAPGVSPTLAGPPHVVVTFTKWITAFPAMGGVTGGDVPGTFVGEVLSRTPFDNGIIIQLDARYGIVDSSGSRSFTTVIHGKSTNGTAVLNGVITEGWMVGARTHVNYETLRPCGTRPVCFQGTIRIVAASAE
jgi:hypothetical protein